MAGYAKIWTDIYNDEWFIKLSCNGRGLWLQMIVYCKHNGDNGEIFLKNTSFCAQLFGIDRATLMQLLRKFADCGRIDTITTTNPLRIKIVKYKYWQELTVKDAKKLDNQKMTPDQTTPEHSRPEHSR